MTAIKKLINEGKATHVAPLDQEGYSRLDESNFGPSLPAMAAEEVLVKSIRLIETIDFTISLTQGEIPWAAITVLVLTTKTVRRALTRFL